MTGEAMPGGFNEDYLPDTLIGLEGLSPEALVAEIVEHIKEHLKELRAGSYDHILPLGSVGELIDYNERLLEDFSYANIGNMSSEALIARYYACFNEENDYLNGVRFA